DYTVVSVRVGEVEDEMAEAVIPPIGRSGPRREESGGEAGGDRAVTVVSNEIGSPGKRRTARGRRRMTRIFSFGCKRHPTGGDPDCRVWRKQGGTSDADRGGGLRWRSSL
ncbi:hypothetical protein THAOC_21473, partial [Thalassiosira oceanica]